MNEITFYGNLDNEDAIYLKEQESKLRKSYKKMADIWGEVLLDARNKYANHGNGNFGNWIEALRISKKTAHKLIERYDYIVYNINDLSSIESIPLSLSYEIIKKRYANFTKFMIEAAEEKLEREKDLEPTKI